MKNEIQSVAKTLQAAYDEFYTDDMTEWRELGGKFKARNIEQVCQQRTFPRVLECGAGEGSVLHWLNNSELVSELYAVEISESGIQQIQKRNLEKLVEVQLFNGYELPYADKSFDMAYCTHVIEHVEHPRLLLRELKRVSEYQVFEVPLDYSAQVDKLTEHFLSYGHINIYTPSLFRFLLKSEGFEILSEISTHIDEEIARFIRKERASNRARITDELSIQLEPLKRLLRKIRLGNAMFQENGFAAFTCLTKSVGELEVF